MSHFLIWLIRVYQRVISPHMNCCVFVESCSHFGIAVLKRYGVIKGCYLITLRLLACQSFVKVPWFHRIVCSDKKSSED